MNTRVIARESGEQGTVANPEELIVSDVHCILTVEKLRHKAEAKVNVNGDTIFAETTEEDMYAAIDSLVDKLDRRVRKHKEKLVDHHARDAQKRKFV